jgi:hypothetical protein
LVQDEKHIRWVWENRITSVESLVKVVRATDENLAFYLRLEKHCGPANIIRAPWKREHFHQNSLAVKRSGEHHKELVDAVDAAKNNVKVAETAYEHSWVVHHIFAAFYGGV